MAEAVAAYRKRSHWKPYTAHDHSTNPSIPLSLPLEDEGGKVETWPHHHRDDAAYKEKPRGKKSNQRDLLMLVGRLPMKKRFPYVRDLVKQLERVSDVVMMCCFTHLLTMKAMSLPTGSSTEGDGNDGT